MLNHVEKLRIIHVRLKIDEDNLSARWECAVLAADTTEIYMADECRMVKGIEAWSEISGQLRQGQKTPLDPSRPETPSQTTIPLT